MKTWVQTPSKHSYKMPGTVICVYHPHHGEADTGGPWSFLVSEHPQTNDLQVHPQTLHFKTHKVENDWGRQPMQSSGRHTDMLRHPHTCEDTYEHIHNTQRKNRKWFASSRRCSKIDIQTNYRSQFWLNHKVRTEPFLTHMPFFSLSRWSSEHIHTSIWSVNPTESHH